MLVAAHRGSRLNAPENTRTALLAGYTGGGEVIEFDLQLSGDGVLVLHHDGTINRMAGLPDTPSRRVDELTLAELRDTDFSPGLARFRDWSDFRYFENAEDKAGVLTFDEALTLLPAEIPKLVELKHDTTKGMGPERVDEFVSKALKCLQDHRQGRNVVLYSMDPRVVQLLRKRAPTLRVCAFDYTMDISDQLDHMRSLNADGLVVKLDDILDDGLDLTEFGQGLQADFDAGHIRVGAVLYPFRGPGIPWIISEAELNRLRDLDFVWSCATDSMIAMEQYLRHPASWVEASFAGADEDPSVGVFGYAKSNPSCRVYQDNGVHVAIDAYEPLERPDDESELAGRVTRLEDEMRYALGDWDFYSGGGFGVVRGLRGDFAAEVDYEVTAPMTQAFTLEMALVNVIRATTSLAVATGDGAGKKTVFDPHGAPPYVGVEADEDDGYRINWNLGNNYDNNRYGRPVGPGGTRQSGRLRIERRGPYFSAYYRYTDANGEADWVCVGGVRNDSLNDVVYLRCVAKRWRQRRSGGGFYPIVANEAILRHLSIYGFRAIDVVSS